MAIQERQFSDYATKQLIGRQYLTNGNRAKLRDEQAPLLAGELRKHSVTLHLIAAITTKTSKSSQQISVQDKNT